MFCEKPVAATIDRGRRGRAARSTRPACRSRSASRGGSTRASLRPGRRSRDGELGLGAHRAVDHAGPGARRRAATSRCRAASSATAASTTSTPSAGSPAARWSRCTRPGSDRGDPSHRRHRRRGTAPRPCSPSTTAPRAVVSNTRYNARGYDVRLEVHGIGGQRRRRAGRQSSRCARLEPGVTFPAGQAVHVLHGPLRRRVPGRRWPRSPRWLRATGPRRARSRMRWRRAGWPRRPRCRWPSTARCASRRCANRCLEVQAGAGPVEDRWTRSG